MPTQCGKCNLWGHNEEICQNDKPQTTVVMEANIEPLKRGLFPTACLKVAETKEVDVITVSVLSSDGLKQNGGGKGTDSSIN